MLSRLPYPIVCIRLYDKGDFMPSGKAGSPALWGCRSPVSIPEHAYRNRVSSELKQTEVSTLTKGSPYIVTIRPSPVL